MYLIEAELKYRVETLSEIDKLKEKVYENEYGEITKFGSSKKEVKVKGEIESEYYIVNVKYRFNDAKQPSSSVNAFFGIGE